MPQSLATGAAAPAGRGVGAGVGIPVIRAGVGTTGGVAVMKAAPMDADGFFNLGPLCLWHPAVIERAKLLVIETAPDAGTRVVVRVPRFHPGVVAS